MSNKTVEVGLKISGDAKGGVAAAEATESALGKLSNEQQRTADTAGDLANQQQHAARETKAAADASAAGAQRVRDLGENAGESAGAISKLSGAMASLFAASKLKGYAGDMIAVADAYGQMASRIEKATASQEEYEYVQKRLLETAAGTYRPLAEAQEMYIRTADALRDLGYSTQQALDIGDSFSYMLVSDAASADKAANAINAYTKSIQSGKVEVDSWQSLLAATPSLVEAIASSTGKTNEEVRRLGITGKLAIADLNEGLRTTRDLNKAVADSMPTTVADAITRLATTWSAYIGEANKAQGATADLVGMINALTENLDSVVSVAIKAGEVMVAVFAVKAVRALKSYVAAQLAAATATKTLTAAQVAQEIASLRAARATTGLAAATKALAASAGLVVAPLATLVASLAAGTAATLSKVKALGLLRGAMLGTGVGALIVGLGALVSKLTESKDAAERAAEAIEDALNVDLAANNGVDKLVWQLKGLETVSLASAEQIQRALSDKIGKVAADDLPALRAALQSALAEGVAPAEQLNLVLAAVQGRLDDIAAAAAQPVWMKYHQSAVPALQAVRDELDTLAKRGPQTADALARIFQAADVSSVAGIKTLLGDLDLIKKSALATGDQLDVALRERLARMTAVELREFRLMAQMALGDTAADASLLANINDQALAASFSRLGIDAAEALNLISSGTQDAVVNIENIVSIMEATGASADRMGAALEMAFSKALQAAKSEADIVALSNAVKGLRESGRIGELSMTRLADAAEAARRRIEGIVPGIQSVEEAFKSLGVVSDAELKRQADAAKDAFEKIKKSGVASAREIQEAFSKYAERAIAANGGVASDALRVEAAMVRVKLSTDKVAESAERSAGEYKKIAIAATEAKDAVEELRTAAAAGYQSPSAGIDFSGLAKGRGAKGEQIAAVSEAASKIYAELMAEKSPDALITPMIQKAMLSKAVDAAIAEVAKAAPKETHHETPSATDANPRAALRIPASSFRIDLSINGGKTTAVNVASRSDAQIFEGFMRELEDAAKRSF